MAKVGINTGTSANAGDGSTLRAGANIINNNFDELYTALGDGTTLAPGIVTSIVAGSNISVTGTGQVTISSGLWEKTDAGINTVSNVGIGTTNPRFTLEVGAVGASGTSLYVNGDARVTGILTVGSSSVTLNGSTNEITVGTGITISGNTGIISATQVNIAGETLTGAGVTSLVAGSNITLSGSTGQVTISSAGGTWANYDSNTGISTTKKVKIENDLEVTGVSTFSGIGTSGALDVDGHTELDDVNVSGASTFAGAADFNGAIDVDGHTELDDLNVSGVATVSTLKVGTAATINSSGLDVVGIASVGVAITMYASSGIVSATSFYGNAIDIDGPYTQTVKTITQSATPTVDLSTGNYFTLTQNANVTSWTFSNPPASGEIFSFVIELANVTYTTTWTLASGTVKWPADTAPTLAASKTHLIIFTTDDGGTTYRASSIVDYTT